MKKNIARNNIVIEDNDIIFHVLTTNYYKDEENIRKELENLLESSALATTGTRALLQNYQTNTSYVLIKVEGYYCWIKSSNDTLEPNIFNNTVYPFDKERCYPIQRVEKEFRFKRW